MFEIGFMQGRAGPKYLGKYQAHPVGNWSHEFEFAQDNNFSCIEFIVDLDEWESNPLFSPGGIKKIQDKDSPVRFIIGTPQTGGYGITLTGASTMIYYSNGYDLEKRQQSEARIDRIGQEKPMTYIDIMAEDTVDMKIVKSLRSKVNIATEIMGEELKDWI